MKIAIIGGGYVGLHTALRLTDVNSNWDLTILDVDSEKIERFNNGKSPIDDYYMDKFINENPKKFEKIKYEKPDSEWKKYDIVFISLSTNPIDKNSSRLNTDLIFELSKKIKLENSEISVVIRSTLNIDDYKKIDDLGLDYWPEFLSQGVETAKNINQKVNVISISKSDFKAEKLFEEVFENKTLIKTGSKESILVKVMHNTLDAYLINITNLFANISDENDIDFISIAPAIETLLQNRPKVKMPGIGYGGSCYPKDSYSLINITKNEQNQKFIQQMEDFNIQQSYAFLNFENLIKSAKKIVVLGSSFKGGTNDTTKTPTKSIRQWMLNETIEYLIWEPMINEKWLLNGEKLSENVIEDIKKSDLVIVASDWQEFNNLLLDYEGAVIDLKSFIKNNGKMNLFKIGAGNKLN